MGIAGQLFLQLAVILLVGRGVGLLMRPLRQPQVVGEMLAGFLLGPSLIGLLAPDLHERIFPDGLDAASSTGVIDGTHPSMTVLFAVGQLGLILYMFLVGARLDLHTLHEHRSGAGRISLTGIVVPAIAGGALGFAVAGDERLFPAGISRGEAALFLAAAMAVTAFPVLARILTDSGMAGTRLGTLALSAAAFDDAVAWSLLALTLALAEGSPGGAIFTMLGTLGFVMAMIWGVRPLLLRIDRMAHPALESARLAGIIAMMFGCAALTEWIGVHAVFGAFIAGAVLPRGQFSEQVVTLLDGLPITILLPVFFVYAGLKTRIGLLDDWSMVWVLVAIIGVAFVGKGGGCFFAMRATGAGWRTAGALGALMNARGLMELTFIAIALERGLITPTLFTMLALMALATTMAAPPLFAWLHRPDPADQTNRAPVAAHPVAPS